MSGKHAGPGRRRQSRRDRRRASTPEAVPALGSYETTSETTAELDTEALSVALEAGDQPHVRSRRRQILLRATAVVAALGIVTSGTIAWTMFRPAINPTESDHTTTSKIRDAWAAGSTHAGYVGIIRIPRFGKKWEFSVIRGTNAKVLANGAGWYEKGARPGAVGNVVVSAHRVTHNAPFHDFPQLRRGDLVEIETKNAVYTYRMMDSGNAITVPDTTTWPLWAVPDPKSRNEPPTERMLTLITCARLFHTDKRLIARAQWVDTDRKPSVA